MVFKLLTRALMVAGAMTIGVSEAMAQDADAKFTLQLNGAANNDAGGCRMTFVAVNRSGQELSDSAYQVGVFDAAGVVRRILVLGFGALEDAKTRIVVFELPDQPCADISRIVVNDVAACKLVDGSDADFCMRGLATSSLTDIQFGI